MQLSEKRCREAVLISNASSVGSDLRDERCQRSFKPDKATEEMTGVRVRLVRHNLIAMMFNESAGTLWQRINQWLVKVWPDG